MLPSEGLLTPYGSRVLYMVSDAVDEMLITARSMKKMYGPHLALDDISLDIPHGAIGNSRSKWSGQIDIFQMSTGTHKDNLWIWKGIGARHKY